MTISIIIIIITQLLTRHMSVITRKLSCRWQTRATLEIRVVSLKGIESDMFLLASYIVTVCVKWIILEIFAFYNYRDLETRVKGHSRSLEMTPLDRSYHRIVYNFLLMYSSNYGSISKRFRDIWRQRIQWPWNPGQASLKVIESDTIR